MNRINRLGIFIRSWEGGYVNHPKDPGGPTNKGITLATFQSVYGKTKTVNDLKNITDEQWQTIFKKYFWDRYKADQIKDDYVAFLLVDWLWGSGKYAITKVQQLLGLKVDGIVGEKTIAKINSYNGKDLFTRLWKLRESFIRGLKNFDTFGKGWLRRLNGIQYGKLIMSNGKVI